MNFKEISENAINQIANHINQRANQTSNIPVTTVEGNTETPHYFEIIPFNEIDNSEINFFAIDGSYNFQEFYNGLSVGVYTAGYVCYQRGQQVRLNDLNDPVILGKSYFPKNILVTNDEHKYAIFDEMLELKPVKNLIDFFGVSDINDIWGWGQNTKETVCASMSKLLSFCQDILEWALIYEIVNLDIVKAGDFILRDGTLRSNNIKQKYLVKLGKYVSDNNMYLLAITKNTPVKLELSSSLKKIDNYMQTKKKINYPFTIKNKRWQKLCCWFEVSDDILDLAYSGGMFAKKGINGGRGFGIFFAARLDYVEKLQNYDWVIVDLNIFDICSDANIQAKNRNIEKISYIFKELTRLTQEHYILGYPYPLVEVHNFVTLKKDFKEEIIKRVKAALYQEQMMDNVDIENLFLDIHERF